MARELGAGDLHHRVAFEERLTLKNGYGAQKANFEERFVRHAAFRPRGGSEAVAADRLEGRNLIGVYVRSDRQTRTIKSDWQLRDIRTGDIYAIKIVDAVTDRKWVYLEAQTGGAAG